MDNTVVTALEGFGADVLSGIGTAVPIALGVIATVLIFNLVVRWIRGATR